MNGVGFIGLGQIGAPMARRWLHWPDGLTVYDIATTATEPFAEAGARVAASPADLAARCTVISVMVRNDAQVDEVVSGDAGILVGANPGTVIMIHSTVEADTPIRLAEAAEDCGVHLIDAPVSGGALGAQEGTLAFMIGGSDAAVAAVREPLAALGTLVAHLGPVGAGTRAKLARNLITFAAFSAAGEATRLAEAAGVDLALLGEVVRHSDRITGGPGAVMLRRDTRPIPETNGLHGIFTHTRSLGEKDLSLALALGEDLGIDLPFARLALERLADSLGVPHTTDGATSPSTDTDTQETP